MHIQLLQAGTKEYDEMIELRMRVLLAPIGIPVTYIKLQKEKEDILIGAYEDGKLLGCCILTQLDGTTVQLRQMAVDITLQKKGIGRSLLHFAESLAKEKGYRTVMMHARDTVMDFYERCGYHMTGEPFFEVGIAHHKMEKVLAQHKKKQP